MNPTHADKSTVREASERGQAAVESAEHRTQPLQSDRGSLNGRRTLRI